MSEIGEHYPPVVNFSSKDKDMIARFVRLAPIRFLLGLAVRILVPRHRTGVTVVCFDSDGRILMLKHVYHPISPWGLPGGWLDRGESPAECASRELHEETGLTATLGPVIFVNREPEQDHIGISYMASLRPAPMQLSSEIIEAGWFRPEDLPEQLEHFVRRSIEAAVMSYPLWRSKEQKIYE